MPLPWLCDVGTDVAYAAISRYAMSGTGVACGDVRERRGVGQEEPGRREVRNAIALRLRYAVSSTAIANRATARSGVSTLPPYGSSGTKSYAESGMNVVYQATLP
eukprot:2389472-Rhodomonas_salina.2